MSSVLDIKNKMDQQPMSRYQWLIVTMCLFLFVIDGFDFMVMAYVASSVGAEFSLNATQIGTLLSSGLIGMTFGSLLIAPLADKIGRKNLVLISLALCAGSMLGAAYTHALLDLSICRFITGIGIGGIQISCMILSTEYSSKRLKSMSVGILSAGYGFGATLGGILAIYLIGGFGWRYVFLFGGIATLLALLLSMMYLPESIDYLLYKQPKQALEKLNKIMSRMHYPRLASLSPAPRQQHKTQGAVRTIFNQKYFLQTLLLWFSMFFILFGFYFVMGWTPKIFSLLGAGATQQSGVTVGMMINAGGMIGCIGFGLICTKFRLFNVHVVFLAATALSVLMLVNATASISLLIMAAIILGLFINGCLAGIYSISTGIYQANVRSTGMGFATGIGRLGGISSPIIAGYFLDQGMPSLQLYAMVSLIFVIAAIGIYVLGKVNNRKEALDLVNQGQGTAQHG